MTIGLLRYLRMIIFLSDSKEKGFVTPIDIATFSPNLDVFIGGKFSRPLGCNCWNRQCSLEGSNTGTAVFTIWKAIGECLLFPSEQQCFHFFVHLCTGYLYVSTCLFGFCLDGFFIFVLCECISTHGTFSLMAFLYHLSLFLCKLDETAIFSRLSLY